MNEVTLKINGISVTVAEGTTVLEAAKSIHIDIPHLCYHPDQTVKAHCRMCTVEVLGRKKLLAACSTVVWDGLEVFTNTQRVKETQVGILQLILADHNQDCLSCSRNGTCELQDLCKRFNITKSNLSNVNIKHPVQNTNPCIVRDLSKCVKCGRCVKVCKEHQGVNALSYSGRSGNFMVTTAYDLPLEETDCTFCGQCSAMCPVGAITEKDDTERVWNALHDPKKHVIVQVAPSVRVALGDTFGIAKGTTVTGKMVTALRLLGFDKVFDTNFGADLTIMEEGHELLHRIQNGEVLPMITSCSPGWVNFIEGSFPHMLPHLSTAKSPQQMFGAIAKTYYPKTSEIDVKDIVTVSIMPCTAKKFEASRPEMGRDGMLDVDIVLTTRELAKMLKHLGIDLPALEDSEFDSPLGTGSGAGAIFGATGGVMEAALRTVYEVLTQKELGKLEFLDVRGYVGIKEASIQIGDSTIKVAVANGLANAKKIMKLMESGQCDYTFIEIMACPGGCIGGGGQPINTTVDVKKLRMDALYEIDNTSSIRKSHENPDIKTLYKDFLGEPLGEMAHHLLHTHYAQKAKKFDF